MKENADDFRVITDYLLKALPEEELEQLDELSVTDDEFVAKLRMVENELIDSYVRGNLTEKRLEQFKAAYLYGADRRQKVDFAHALQAFGKKHPLPLLQKVQSGKSINPQPEMTAHRWFELWEVFRTPRLAQFGFAMAALVLLIVGGLLAIENIRHRRQLSQERVSNSAAAQQTHEAQRDAERQPESNSTREKELASNSNANEKEQHSESKTPVGPPSTLSGARRNVSISSFVLTPQMRGPGEIKIVTLPAHTSVVAIKVQLEPNQYSSYQVVLLNESNQSLWRSNTINMREKTDYKNLSISFPAALLKQGTHVLQVYGIDRGQSELLGDYPFRVMK